METIFITMKTKNLARADHIRPWEKDTHTVGLDRLNGRTTRRQGTPDGRCHRSSSALLSRTQILITTKNYETVLKDIYHTQANEDGIHSLPQYGCSAVLPQQPAIRTRKLVRPHRWTAWNVNSFHLLDSTLVHCWLAGWCFGTLRRWWRRRWWCLSKEILSRSGYWCCYCIFLLLLDEAQPTSDYAAVRARKWLLVRNVRLNCWNELEAVRCHHRRRRRRYPLLVGWLLLGRRWNDGWCFFVAKQICI